MADERLRIKIEADAKRAERDLENLAELGDELTDDDMTIVVRAKADAAEGEIKRLTRLLAQADDPVDIKVITTGIKQARDEITQLNKLVDQVDAQDIDIDTSKSVKNLDDLGKSADSSKSVLANMIGNSAQDLGALGGVAGSTGVAIGQMAEYMADAKAGGDSFSQIIKGFGGVIGPVIALSVGVAAATAAWKAYNEKTKETARLTKELSGNLSDVTGVADDIAAAVGDGQDAWSLLNQALAKTPEQFQKASRAMGTLGRDSSDLSSTLADIEEDAAGALGELARGAGIPAGLAAEFGKAVAAGEDMDSIFNILPESAQKSFDAYEKQIAALEELNDAQQNFDLETVATEQLNLAAAVDTTTRALVDQARAAVGPDGTELDAWREYVELQGAVDAGAALVKGTIEGGAAAIRDWATAADEARTANEELRESLFNTADAELEATRSWADLNDEVDAFKKIAEPTRADVEKLNDTVFDYANAQLEAAGMTRDTTEGARLYKDALGQAAGVLGSEMNPELQTYIDKALAVPDTAVTTVTADTAAATAELDTLTKPRTIDIELKPAGGWNLTTTIANAIRDGINQGGGRSTQSSADRYANRNGRGTEGLPP